MSVSCSLPRGDLQSLNSHECHLCDKCLVCHYCLLSRRYLRNHDIEVPEEHINSVINAILKTNDEPPRYILVGPNNEIMETRPNFARPKQKSKEISNENPNNFVRNPSNIVSLATLPYQEEVVHDAEQSTPDQKPIVIVLEPTIFSCGKCDKSFTSLHDLDMHKIYHTAEERHECKVCKKTFNFSYELIKHSVCHEVKPHICKYCKKTFKSETKLNIHMRVHTGARPFVCPVCEKTFKENGTMKCHLRTHSEERPFKCKACGRGFKFRNKLDTHNMIHEGLKPFVCFVCEKTFRHKCNLKTHCLKYHNTADE